MELVTKNESDFHFLLSIELLNLLNLFQSLLIPVKFFSQQFKSAQDNKFWRCFTQTREKPKAVPGEQAVFRWHTDSGTPDQDQNLDRRSPQGGISWAAKIWAHRLEMT